MKKILITGIFRSGTTFLTRMLSTHKDIIATYQPITPFLRLARKKFIIDFLNKDINNIPMGINYFSEEEEKKFDNYILTLKFSEKEINILREQLYDNLKIEPNEKPQFLSAKFEDIKEDTFINLLEYFYRKHKIITNTNIVAIKEVWAEEFCLPLLKTDNDFNIIHIFRDIRAIYASRNTGNYLKLCNNKKYPLLFFIFSWKRSFKYMKKCQEFNKYMYIKYEDMILDLEKVAKKISNFLNIDFDINMIDPKQYKDGRGEKWKSNSTNKSVDFIEKSSIDNWKTVLTEQEIGIIEYLCQNELSELGYNRITNFNKEDFLNYYENESDIIDWLQIELLKLNTNKLNLIEKWNLD